MVAVCSHVVVGGVFDLASSVKFFRGSAMSPNDVIIVIIDVETNFFFKKWGQL